MKSTLSAEEALKEEIDGWVKQFESFEKQGNSKEAIHNFKTYACERLCGVLALSRKQLIEEVEEIIGEDEDELWNEDTDDALKSLGRNTLRADLRKTLLGVK